MPGTEFQRTASGAEARRGGTVVATLSGDLRESDLGAQAWIETSGEVSLVPDLYALAAAPWVEAGCLSHNVVVAADDREAIETWFGLCFGRQQVYAELDLSANDETSQSSAIVVREGTVEDAVALGDPIFALAAGPPVWSGYAPRGPQELREVWTETLADPGGHYLVAELGGRAAGYVLLWREADGVAVLGVAGTVEELRGRGVGSTLTGAAVAWARAEGFHTLVTDWRSTNLLASRFWPARGFRPVRYRLHRLVGR